MWNTPSVEMGPQIALKSLMPTTRHVRDSPEAPLAMPLWVFQCLSKTQGNFKKKKKKEEKMDQREWIKTRA